MKCKHCGGETYIAYQLARATILVDEFGEFKANIYDDFARNIDDYRDPYGPYQCCGCGATYDELAEGEKPTSGPVEGWSWDDENAEQAPKAVKREFFVDTPLGKLKVYAKHETDSPHDFPGVYVDLVTNEGSEMLACVEYASNIKQMQTCAYQVGCDSPESVVVHEIETVSIIRAGTEEIIEVPFDTIQAGDIFFVNGDEQRKAVVVPRYMKGVDYDGLMVETEDGLFAPFELETNVVMCEKEEN